MKQTGESASIPFSMIENVACPKCGSIPTVQCRIMAGRGKTGKSKLVPHMERVFSYLNRIKGNPSPCI